MNGIPERWLDSTTLTIDRSHLTALVPYLPESSALDKVHHALTEARYDRIWINNVTPLERTMLTRAIEKAAPTR